MTPVSLKGVTADTAAVSTSRGMAPTDEQQPAIDLFRTGAPFVLEAGAGTGKTTTLKMLAAAAPLRRGVYVAYNRAIADDARASFPQTVTCATAHSFAYREVGKRFRDRLNSPRIPSWKAAEILGCEAVEIGPGRTLRRNAVARAAIDAVRNFCNSADQAPGAHHVPHVDGIDSVFVGAFRTDIAGYAQHAWKDLQGRAGQLKFDHDVYLKLWQLSGPRLQADYVLLDEAQDANPVIADVVLCQGDAQLIAVGDAQQAIYSWRGAVDAMRDWPAEHRLPLTQSFRFGQPIADEANVWLEKLGVDLRLRGFDRVVSRVGTIPVPDAILCRTNAEAVAQALVAIEAGERVAIVGGVAQIRSMARAAQDLKSGTGTDHPELCAFASWAEVQEYVEDDHAAADLRVLVQLVDRYGVGGIYRVTDAVVEERDASLVVSTAHKAKGREWGSVLIAPDFRPPKDVDELERSEAMLAYVAVTRAKCELDNSALAWADEWTVRS